MYREMTDQVRNIVSSHLAGTTSREVVVAIEATAEELGLYAVGDPDRDALCEDALMKLVDDVTDEVADGLIVPAVQRASHGGDVEKDRELVARWNQQRFDEDTDEDEYADSSTVAAEDAEYWAANSFDFNDFEKYAHLDNAV